MSHAFHLTSPGQLRRDARIIGLLFASTTSMIGSGWLFGAFHAAKIAGPLSIWSWVVGGFIIMLIALCFAELAALFPKSGALVHMSHASHGEGLGRIWAWMLFLAYVAVPSVEAEAVVTYANNYLPYFIQPDSSGLLTVAGLLRLRRAAPHFRLAQSARGAHAADRQFGRDLVEDRGAGRDHHRPHPGELALERLGGRSPQL